MTIKENAIDPRSSPTFSLPPPCFLSRWRSSAAGSSLLFLGFPCVENKSSPFQSEGVNKKIIGLLPDIRILNEGIAISDCSPSLWAFGGRVFSAAVPSMSFLRPCARGKDDVGIDFGFYYQTAARVRVRIPAARKASGLCVTSRPRRDEGAGKTGCTPHPRSRVQLRTGNAHTSIQVQAEHPGLPCAVALRLTSCSPRRTALLPPSPPRSLLLENSMPAPRHQDHTTSPYARATHVNRSSRVHRIPPRVRDDRDPPLSSGETDGVMRLICP